LRIQGGIGSINKAPSSWKSLRRTSLLQLLLLLELDIFFTSSVACMPIPVLQSLQLGHICSVHPICAPLKLYESFASFSLTGPYQFSCLQTISLDLFLVLVIPWSLQSNIYIYIKIGLSNHTYPPWTQVKSNLTHVFASFLRPKWGMSNRFNMPARSSTLSHTFGIGMV